MKHETLGRKLERPDDHYVLVVCLLYVNLEYKKMLEKQILHVASSSQKYRTTAPAHYQNRTDDLIMA